jgi:hypothetical protein
MRTSMLTKPLVVLGAVGAMSSIAAGGTRLAIYEQNPHFGGTSFIAISGRTPKDSPEIAVRCTQGGTAVKNEKASARAGGVYFTWGGNDWTSGGADCRAQLLTSDRRGRVKVQAELLFPVSG